MMRNQVALWAAVSSFFGSLMAIGAINIFNPDSRVRFVGGIVVGLITGGAVYAKQRLDDAKQERIHAGTMVVKDTGEKKVFTLELGVDPAELENKKEVVFKVDKIESG